jgi:hypothetical protein
MKYKARFICLVNDSCQLSIRFVPNDFGDLLKTILVKDFFAFFTEGSTAALIDYKDFCVLKSYKRHLFGGGNRWND